jgi:hypothetical protein
MQHAFEPQGQPTSARRDTKPTLKAGSSLKKKKKKGKKETIVDNNKTLGD